MRVCVEAGCRYDRRTDCDGCGASLCVYHANRSHGRPWYMMTNDEGKRLSYCSDCVKADGCGEPDCDNMASKACPTCGKRLCVYHSYYSSLRLREAFCAECVKTVGMLPPQIVQRGL